MDNESTQVSNPPLGHSTLGRYSLWLGGVSIVLCVFARVFAYVMYDKNTPALFRSLMQKIEEPISFLSVIGGLLAMLVGSIAYRRSKKSDGNRKNRTAQAGIVLGILAVIPACLFVCGYLLLALATGY